MLIEPSPPPATSNSHTQLSSPESSLGEKKLLSDPRNAEDFRHGMLSTSELGIQESPNTPLSVYTEKSIVPLENPGFPSIFRNRVLLSQQGIATEGGKTISFRPIRTRGVSE